MSLAVHIKSDLRPDKHGREGFSVYHREVVLREGRQEVARYAHSIILNGKHDESWGKSQADLWQKLLLRDIRCDNLPVIGASA
jgi:hypothetical protein